MPFSKILMVACGMALSFSLQASPAANAGLVTIELSHHLDEVQAERLGPLVENFNKQNKGVEVKLARRVEGDAPRQINLVTRDEYSRFMDNKASFKPLHQVMREAKVAFDTSKLAPELRDGLVDTKGQLFALPVAFSTPVLFINKDAFRKAGLDPESPPRTWADTQDAAVARRVFSPADYLSPKTPANQPFAANSDLTVRLWIEAREIAAAGYRLYVFYP